jgi:hypothetical protein
LATALKLPALSVVTISCSFQGQLMPTCTPASPVGGGGAVHVTEPVAVVTQSPPLVCFVVIAIVTTILAAAQVAAAIGSNVIFLGLSSSEPKMLARPAKTMGIKSNLFHFMLRPPGLKFESDKESRCCAQCRGGHIPWVESSVQEKAGGTIQQPDVAEPVGNSWRQPGAKGWNLTQLAGHLDEHPTGASGQSLHFGAIQRPHGDKGKRDDMGEGGKLAR